MTDCAEIMIVTYNRLDLTKRTLSNLFKTTHFPYRLIFVDNGSSDATCSEVDKICSSAMIGMSNLKSFTILKNAENKGIAIGRNQALKASSAEWLVTFDNDVIVPDGWLTECIDILKKNPQYASIGVNMEVTSYPIVKLNGKEFQDKPRGNLGTACMVFNRKLHKMLEFFNHKDYGKYGEEDADWGMRTRVVGFKLGYIKENGTHIGDGEFDVGEYREFKTKQHKDNLAKFNANCQAYYSRKLPLYISFDENE